MRVKIVPTPKWIQQAANNSRLQWSLKSPKNVYNGTIAAVVNVYGSYIEVCWVDYCLKWAQDKDLLVDCFPIFFLSVCAIVTSHERILVGLRSSNVANYQRLWEFAPAGGVSKLAGKSSALCLTSQIMSEWKEELKASVQLIASIKNTEKPIFIPQTCTWIVLYKIETLPFCPSVNEEVSAWRWLSKDQLLKELSNNDNLSTWVPGSGTIYDHCYLD